MSEWDVDGDIEKTERNGNRDEKTYIYISTSFLPPNPTRTRTPEPNEIKRNKQKRLTTHLFDQVLTRNESILLKRPRFLTGDAYTGGFV